MSAIVVLVLACLAALSALPGLSGPDVVTALVAAGFTGALALVLIWLRRPEPQQHWIVVDGSNVMHWEDEEARLETVARVLSELLRAGFHPLVWFDANVGYKVGTRYMGPSALAQALPVPWTQIRVAPKGTPADPLLLEDAVKRGAKVVTCDKFRDWVETYPAVAEEGFLIRGRVEKGVAVFEFG